MQSTENTANQASEETKVQLPVDSRPVEVTAFWNQDGGLVSKGENIIDGTVKFTLTNPNSMAAVATEIVDGFVCRLLQVYPAVSDGGISGDAEIDRVNGADSHVRYWTKAVLSDVIAESDKTFVVELEDSHDEIAYVTTDNIAEFTAGLKSFPLEYKEITAPSKEYLEELRNLSNIRYLDLTSLDEDDQERTKDPDVTIHGYDQELNLGDVDISQINLAVSTIVTPQ